MFGRKHPCPGDKARSVDDGIRQFGGEGYANIQQYVKKKYGFVPKTCWIADRKEKLGFDIRTAWNRGT